MDTQALIQDFLRVAALAGARLAESEIEVETLKAPHRPPSRLPAGKMAVYVFSCGDTVLKVGKAGPNSGARYTSQHYNAASARSTLAASLLKGGDEIGVSGLTVESAGPRCQGSCRLSEMESGVGWGRKVDYRDETLLSRT